MMDELPTWSGKTPFKLIEEHLIKNWVNKSPENKKWWRRGVEKVTLLPTSVFWWLISNGDGSLREDVNEFENIGGEEVKKVWTSDYKATFRVIKLQGVWVGWWNILKDHNRCICDLEWLHRICFVELVDEPEDINVGCAYIKVWKGGIKGEQDNG